MYLEGAALERLQEHFQAIEECLAHHAYDRALEHYGKTLEFLQQQDEKGVEDQKASLRNRRAELLMQLGRWDQALEDIDRTLSAEDVVVDGSLVVRALLQSAQISSYYGDYNEAISTLERAWGLAESRGQRADQAAVQLELGTVFARIGEPVQGKEKLESILELLQPPESLSGDEALLLAGASMQLGLAAFRERKVKEARDHYQRSLQICWQHAPDTRIEADTLRYLGILSNLQGQNPEALRYHRQALEIYHTLRLSLGLAKTYGSIGQSCLDMSRLDEALFFTHKAERLSRRLGADAEVAALYGRLGNIYLQMGDYTRAVEFHLKDIEMCRRFGNYRAIAYAMHNLGLSYRGKGDIEEALHYLQESLQRFVELGDYVYAARLHLDIARSFLDRSRLAEAEEQIEETEKYLEGAQPSAELGYARLLMGSLHRLWQNYETAETSLTQGIETLRGFGPSPHLAESHFELGMLYTEIGEPGEALGHLKEALRLARKLEMRSVMLDSIHQIERLNEMELVNLLLEEVEQRPVTSPFKSRGQSAGGV